MWGIEQLWYYCQQWEGFWHCNDICICILLIILLLLLSGWVKRECTSVRALPYQNPDTDCSHATELLFCYTHRHLFLVSAAETEPTRRHAIYLLLVPLNRSWQVEYSLLPVMKQYQPDSGKHRRDTGMNQVLKYSINNKKRENELLWKHINIHSVYGGVSVGW